MGKWCQWTSRVTEYKWYDRMNRPEIKTVSIWHAFLLGIMVLGVSIVEADEKKLYRYHNAEGVLVIDHKVPPEFVDKGYDVVSKNGQLILRVPPYTEKKEGELDADKQGGQSDSDEYLLRSYSSVAEIDAASDRKLLQLQNEIQVIEKNLGDARALRQAEQKRAANMQRGGRKVSESLLRHIKLLDRQQQDALQMLEVRRKEYTEVEARYKDYADRYRQLTASQPARNQDETVQQ